MTGTKARTRTSPARTTAARGVDRQAAATGASLRELMDRMGHSTTRAALIYQHGSVERDRLIAAGISELATAERGRSTSQSGTQRARERKRA